MKKRCVAGEKPASRKPPKSIRRTLRTEVGFGCPLCGSPYLEYHHFDPPWAEAKQHNTDGMIALCARHHDDADGGAFTREQLTSLKRDKNQHQEVAGRFNWRRKHTVFECGGNYAYECGGMLQVSGIDIVYFEKDEDGYDTLSLNIYDVCLNPIFRMRMNDWLARTDVEDIETPPRTPLLKFKSTKHRVDLKISFLDRSKLCEQRLNVADHFGIPKSENVIFVILSGKLPAPTPVTISETSLEVGVGLSMTGNKFQNGQRAIVIN